MTDRTIKFTLTVDAGGVVRKVTDTAGAFDRLGAAAQAGGVQAQQGFEQVDRAARAAQASQSAFIGGLREQVALYGRSEGDVLRYRAAQAGVAQEAAGLILQLENQKAAHQQAAIAAMQEQAAQREAAAAKRSAEQASDAFVASLREQVATMGMSRTEMLAYRAAQLGVAAQAAPLIASLQQSDRAMGGYGMTAGQLSQAMRMLPMQMTDVVTSLASGMPVWMVAIQQGGQLRDSFGGIGPMFRAIASTISPLSLALSAVGVVLGVTALAWSQGEQEASAYNKALILTGNHAGTTSGQLGDMAQRLAEVNGTVGAHASALAQVAATGKVSAGVMEEISAAAVAMEGATGRAVSDTVAEFVRLGEAPAEASAKLNRQYHYLTSSVYAQIAALEEQGRKEEAAELAQRTYAAAIQERAGRVRENLGTLERAWAFVGSAAKKAWDLMLNIGREDSTQQKIDAAQESVRTARERLEGMRALASTPAAAIAAAERALELAEDQVANMREMRKLEAQGAASQAANARANDAAIAQQRTQSDILKRYATDAQRLKAALDEAAEAFGGVIPKDVEARIRASFKGVGAAAKKELDEAARAAQAYRDLAADLTTKDIGFNSDFNNKLATLRDGWSAAGAKAEDYAAAVNALIAQQPFYVEGERRALKAAEEASQARVAARTAEQKAIDDWSAAESARGLAAARAAEEAANAAAREFDQHGKTRSQIAEVTLARLQDRQAALYAGSEAYNLLQREIDAQQRLVEVLRRGEVRDAASKAASEAAQDWERSAQDIERALTDSLYRSFEAGGDFFETFWASIKNTLKSTVLKVAVQAVVGGVTGSLGLSGAANAAGGLSGAASTLSNLSSLSSAGTIASLGATLGNFTAGLSAGFSQFTAGVNTFASLGNAAAVGGSTGAGIGIGAAAPWVAGIMALAAITRATRGETRGGGQYGVGATASGTYALDGASFISGPSGGQIESEQVKAAIAATVAGINATLKAVGSAASLAGFQAALETSDRGRGGVYAGGTLSSGATFGEAGLGGGRSNYNGTLYETTSATSLGAQEALQNFSADLLQATIQALQAANDIPKAVADMLRGVDAEQLSAEAAAQLIEAVKGMAAFTQAVQSLPFTELHDLSAEAASGLVQLMGGVDALGSALSSYYDAFYTEEERRAQSMRNLQQTFAGLGLAMPDLTQSGEAARAQFRALVEAQDLNTEQGRQAYAALMGVAGAYAELTPLGLQAAASVDAVTGEVRALSQTMVDLGRENASLQDQYDRLTLSQADYRAKTIAGYSEEERAAAAANFALADQIAMLQEVARLDQQRTAMENQLLEVQGDTAALRERELATLPESLRALQQRIYLLTDEAAAAQEAARQAQEVATARAAMAQQLEAMERQLLELEGNTAEIRRRELEALDPSLRAIQQLVYARTDEVAATQAATQAAQASAQQRLALEQQLMQLTGDTAGLRARELAALSPANQSLQQQIYALQDQAAAASSAEQALQQLSAEAQALAQRAQAVATERAAIEREYLQLTGDTLALRRIELAGLDPSNQALKERNFALQDQIAAEQASAQAAQRAAQVQQQAAQQVAQAAQQLAQQAAQAAQQVAAEGMSIYRRLLTLQGDTAALRALELDELDPINRALQEQVWALEDAQAAMAAATGAQQTYTDAVADSTEFLAAAGRTIAEYFSTLSATPAGLGSPQSRFNAARAQFEAQYQAALGGDRNALSGITGAADQYIDARRATATSDVDVRRLIAELETRLGALPALVRPEALIVAAIEQQTVTTTGQASSLNSEAIAATLAANRAAIAAAIADAERLTAAAEAQAAAIIANASAQAAATIAAVNAGSRANVNTLVSQFDRLDATADGLLSDAELRAALGPLATDSVLRQVFATLDADGDGQISRLEAIASNTLNLGGVIASALAPAFDQLDTSVDGLLSDAELRAALGPLATDSVLRQVFATLDADGDGQISRLEAIRSSSALTATTTGGVRDQASLTADRMAQSIAQLAGILTHVVGTFEQARRLNNSNDWIADSSHRTMDYTAQELAAARDILNLNAEVFAMTDANGAAIRTGNVLLDLQLSSIRSHVTLTGAVQELTRAMLNAAATSATVLQQIGSGTATVRTVVTDRENHAVVNPTNPSVYFATGAAFLAPGVYSRPTDFPLARFAEAGAEGVLPLANVGGRLGINAAGVGGNQRELVAEVRALRAELAGLRSEAQATVLASNRSARILDRLERDGLTVRTESDQPLATVAA